jgi:hypothetical protein
MSLSGVQNNKVNNNFQNFIEGAKKVGKVVGYVLAAVVFAVAHPIIGPLGSLGCLFAAAYHGLALNYHWHHSREKDGNGNFIVGTMLINQSLKDPYSNINPGYTKKDLPRLYHEKERLYHENAARDNLKWARGLAKCTIPIVGLFWALISESNTGGCVDIGYDRFKDDWHDKTREQKLKHHIHYLETS